MLKKVNFVIVQQSAKDADGEDILVDIKNLEWRPSSPKEIAAGAGQFKRLGTPTFRIHFKPENHAGIFSLVAQLRPMVREGEEVKEIIDGKEVVVREWRCNLHDPEITKAVDMVMRNRTTVVSIDQRSAVPWETSKTRTTKASTGTSIYSQFFGRAFPNRIRNQEIRAICQQLLDDAIAEREAAIEDAKDKPLPIAA